MVAGLSAGVEIGAIQVRFAIEPAVPQRFDDHQPGVTVDQGSSTVDIGRCKWHVDVVMVEPGPHPIRQGFRLRRIEVLILLIGGVSRLFGDLFQNHGWFSRHVKPIDVQFIWDGPTRKSPRSIRSAAEFGCETSSRQKTHVRTMMFD